MFTNNIASNTLHCDGLVKGSEGFKIFAIRATRNRTASVNNKAKTTRPHCGLELEIIDKIIAKRSDGWSVTNSTGIQYAKIGSMGFELGLEFIG